ncbi:MAG: hypothetical protein ACI35J_09285, partial [Peribacillus sp.]
WELIRTSFVPTAGTEENNGMKDLFERTGLFALRETLSHIEKAMRGCVLQAESYDESFVRVYACFEAMSIVLYC